MGKRKVYVLIAVMSIVVTLLILVQVNIINNAARIKEEQFGQLVKRCLMHVATRLEEEEAKQLFLDERFAQQFGMPTGSNPRTTTTSPDKIVHKQINFSLNLSQDPSGKVHAEATLDTIVNVEQSYPIQDPKVFEELGELNEWEQRRFLQSIRNRDMFTRNFQYQLMLANRPIEQRIDPRFLAALLKNEFIFNGINIDYEYVVKSYNQGEERIIIKSGNYKSAKVPEHQTPLFTNDLGIQKPNYLKVYFPTSRREFIKSTSFMVYPTLILVAFIIGIFAYTIAILFKEKKLSIIKNDFINNMTHEFKTPISTISLASQMLRDNSVTNTPTAIDRISGVIFEESKRLSMQVEKVLQQAIFNEGRMKMKFKEFDLHEVIDSVITNSEIRVHSLDGKITLSKNATNFIIYGDQVHITNVLYNLLDNAVKYSKEAPVIEVSTQNHKDYLEISVKDNGIGIAKEHQKQIFERFFRVPTGNVHDVKGFGLGLHYVSKIIEAHNGSIKVESALNKGTKFIINFPIKEMSHGSKS